MCYLVRQHPSAAEAPAGATPPKESSGLRPRWVAAAGAALVGTLAFAALLTPAPRPAGVDAREAAAIPPVASKAHLLPVSTGGGQSSLPADDGVPGGQETAKASLGGCHHGL